MRRLRDLREDKDLNQIELADLIGCSQATYSRYESGALGVPSDVLIKLAKFYNVSVDYILEIASLEYKKRSSTSFVISMTKAELANFLNIEKQELSDILSNLIKSNIIANKNRLYTLIDLSFFKWLFYFI